MKHILILIALALATLSFADSTPAVIPKFEPIKQTAPALPPPTTYNIEAIYDRYSKGAAVGASAFWKRFSKKDKYVDVYFFGGLDKKQVPVGALLFKNTWQVADQFAISYGPAFEWSQAKTPHVTLFVGVTLK